MSPDPSTAALVVEPLSPARWPALAALFSEGGDPKWCWSTWQVATGPFFAS